ncbi:MAG: NADH-quinone oxidoreductase subunit NuoN [Rhodospirillaceae bacterium]|nr:NADH-quinone oxidoreductase subunit NuoN [Rhodospirillaceae bacterium]
MTQMPNLVPAYAEIFLALSGLLLLMVGVFRKTDPVRGVARLAILAFSVAGVLVLTTNAVAVTTFSGMFAVNAFTSFAKLLVLLGGGFAVFLMLPWAKNEGIARFELPVVMVFAVLGMMMMISANDLISLYVGLELQSLSLYVLAAFHRGNLRATEAGVKYFILGALASGLLLYGSSLIYGFAGTTSFVGLASALSSAQENVGVIVGMVFVISGLAFKISAVPFHMWTPDVYEGSPTPVTAFFSVAPKIAALCLFLRILVGPFDDLMFQWRQVLIVICVASMLWGAVAAIAQSNIKRLMAYSSIGHVGYALIGLVAATPEGARGMIYYMLIYLFMNVGTFAVILSMRVKDRYVEGVNDLSGLSKTNPAIALALTVLMFSMAGIPPLAGFFGKYFVFVAAINAGLIPLAVIGVLSSVIGAYYYLRLIKIMYFDEAGEGLDKPDLSTGVVMGVCALAVVVFILVPEPMLAGADAAAAALFQG